MIEIFPNNLIKIDDAIYNKHEPEYWQALITQFGSAKGISVNTDIGYKIAYFNLKKHGIAASNKAKARQLASSITDEQLLDLYKEHKSGLKVGQILGLSRDQVLRRLPTELKEENRRLKYTCNEYFFNHDNELSLYWAGFLTADAALMLKDGKYKQLGMSLAIKDRERIETFVKDIEFEGNIHNKMVKASKGHPEWNDSKQVAIEISSDGLYDVLFERFNITPNKTFTSIFPERLVEHPLVHHFIRGYFDGDGSVHWGKPYSANTTNQLYFSLRGTPEFLRIVRDILEINTNVRKRGDAPIRVNTNMGILEYGGNGILLSIRDFLYKDATTYMQRKYDLFFHPDVKKYDGPRSENWVNRDKSNISKSIIATNILTGEQTYFSKIADASILGLSANAISGCLGGRQKAHKGYTFTFSPKPEITI